MPAEQRFIQRLAKSQVGAWDEFVELYEPRILGFARTWGLQDADAHDVTQNVLISVTRAVKYLELDETRGTFWNWIATVTHREILRRQGQLSRLASNGTGLEERAVAKAARSSEWLFHLYALALQQTESRCRPTDWRVFQAVWIDGRDPRDVAKEAGHSAAWVYRAKFRALEILRHQVAKLTDDCPFVEFTA